MAADSAAVMRPGRFTRGRFAFRRWRRNRPFWGGLFMMLSGLFLFGSGNLQPGNFQIHLGVEGFLSYLVPAVMILCGALVWATPAQRMFYGILGVLAALYSLVSVNLGGFLIGMLLGVIGGSLAVAWVPVKPTKAPPIPAQRRPEPDDTVDPEFWAAEDPTGEIPAPTGAHAMPDDDPTGADPVADSGTEGKQGARFPQPRHATGDSGGTVARTRRHIPRTAIVVAAALTFTGAISVVTLRDPAPAAAAACTPPSLSQVVNSAKAANNAKHSKRTASKAVGDGLLTGRHGSSTDGSGIVGDLVGGLSELLTGGPATPLDSPSVSPSTTPSASPSPSPDPSASPRPSPSGTPSPRPSDSKSPTKSPIPTRTGATPSPSASCAIVAKMLAAAGNQVTVEGTPAIQTADTLTMSGLSYDGNVELPTKNGTIEVMQFSMDSSTSTPFELDVTTQGHTMKIKSSKLTVSGTVTFYATEIKGNVLGVLAADYTPDNPPPPVPSDLFFTDVTIGLVNLVCDSLSADNLTIG